MSLVRTPSRWFTLLVIAAACLGCTESRPRYATARLEGTLSIDGVPVSKGSVQFQPVGKSQPGAGMVKDGHYVAERVPLGKVRVLFTALRETGKSVREGTHEFPELVSLVPPKFRSGLELEVTGDNPAQDFALQSR